MDAIAILILLFFLIEGLKIGINKENKTKERFVGTVIAFFSTLGLILLLSNFAEKM